MRIKTDGYSIMIFILFFIFGVIFTLQIKTTLTEKKASLTVEQKIKEYTDEIKQYSDKQKIMEEKIARQEEILNQNIKDTSNYTNTKIKDRYVIALSDANLKAGLTDVRGPGLKIVVSDAPKEEAGDQDDLNNYLIHDMDLMKLLNELKIAGAEAISINGERLVTSSEIVCAGPTVRINNFRYPSPYTIKVIGNPDKMIDQLNNSYIIQELNTWDINVDIERKDQLKINKFKYSIDDHIKYLKIWR